MTFNEVIFTVSGQEYTLGQLLIIPVVLIAGYLLISWLSRLISGRLIAHNMQPDIVHLIRRIFYIVALIVLAVTTLELLNVPLTAFAFVSGAIAIGVGFGAQNIINNFISGWILMWERPIPYWRFSRDWHRLWNGGVDQHPLHADSPYRWCTPADPQQRASGKYGCQLDPG